MLAHRTKCGGAGDARANGTIAGDDEGRGGLHDAKAGGKIDAVSEIDVDMLDAGLVSGKSRQQASNSGAASAGCRRELYERGAIGKPREANLSGVDDRASGRRYRDAAIPGAHVHAQHRDRDDDRGKRGQGCSDFHVRKRTTASARSGLCVQIFLYP